MRCRICGRDCPPGAKICRDCAAARKRAFAQTVTQPLLAAVGAPSVSSPSIGRPRFAPRPARPRAANDAAVARAPQRPQPDAALPLTVVPRKLGWLWFTVAAAILVAVGITVWRTVGSGGNPNDEVTPVTRSPAPAVELLQTPQPVVTLAPQAPVDEAPPVKIAPSKAVRKAPPRVEPSVPAPQAPVPVAEPAPVERAPAPPRPIEVPRPDPLAALNEGLSRCAREPLFDRMACEQRVRSQYCGSSWGIIAQCPIGPATDHGQ